MCNFERVQAFPLYYEVWFDLEENIYLWNFNEVVFKTFAIFCRIVLGRIMKSFTSSSKCEYFKTESSDELYNQLPITLNYF